jgi:two-component system, OmpR family, response regulator
MDMRILIVEDEKKVSSFIKKGMEEEYYTVDTAFDGKEGLRLASSEDYDLIIMDVMLPNMDGNTVTKELRKRNINIPVLMLTVNDSIKDKVKGLDSGADDYLTKPFAFEELLARVRALLRRNEKSKSTKISAGDIVLDLESHRVIKSDKEIILTPKEYSILEYLIKNKNKVVSRTRLIEHTYDYHFDTETNIIDVYINKVRNKIFDNSDSPLIKTIRGIGYIIKDE